MKASAPIARARQLLSDESDDPRFEDAELIALCAICQAETYRLRNDCVCTDDAIGTTAPTPVTELASECGVGNGDQFLEAFAHYITGKALADDSEAGGNAELSAFHLAEYGRLIS